MYQPPPRFSRAEKYLLETRATAGCTLSVVNISGMTMNNTSTAVTFLASYFRALYTDMGQHALIARAGLNECC